MPLAGQEVIRVPRPGVTTTKAAEASRLRRPARWCVRLTRKVGPFRSFKAAPRRLPKARACERRGCRRPGHTRAHRSRGLIIFRPQPHSVPKVRSPISSIAIGSASAFFNISLFTVGWVFRATPIGSHLIAVSSTIWRGKKAAKYRGLMSVIIL